MPKFAELTDWDLMQRVRIEREGLSVYKVLHPKTNEVAFQGSLQDCAAFVTLVKRGAIFDWKD